MSMERAQAQYDNQEPPEGQRTCGNCGCDWDYHCKNWLEAASQDFSQVENDLRETLGLLKAGSTILGIGKLESVLSLCNKCGGCIDGFEPIDPSEPDDAEFDAARDDAMERRSG